MRVSDSDTDKLKVLLFKFTLHKDADYRQPAADLLALIQRKEDAAEKGASK